MIELNHTIESSEHLVDVAVELAEKQALPYLTEERKAQIADRWVIYSLSCIAVNRKSSAELIKLLVVILSLMIYNGGNKRGTLRSRVFLFDSVASVPRFYICKEMRQ